LKIIGQEVHNGMLLVVAVEMVILSLTNNQEQVVLVV
jgi:hypothetical protein